MMDIKEEGYIKYYRVPETACKGRLFETLSIIWSIRKSFPLLFAGIASMLFFSASLITSVGAFFLGMAFLTSLSGYLKYMKMKRRMERAAIRAELERRAMPVIREQEREAA